MTVLLTIVLIFSLTEENAVLITVIYLEYIGLNIGTNFYYQIVFVWMYMYQYVKQNNDGTTFLMLNSYEVRKFSVHRKIVVFLHVSLNIKVNTFRLIKLCTE